MTFSPSICEWCNSFIPSSKRCLLACCEIRGKGGLVLLELHRFPKALESSVAFLVRSRFSIGSETSASLMSPALLCVGTRASPLLSLDDRQSRAQWLLEAVTCTSHRQPPGGRTHGGSRAACRSTAQTSLSLLLFELPPTPISCGQGMALCRVLLWPFCSRKSISNL